MVLDGLWCSGDGLHPIVLFVCSDHHRGKKCYTDGGLAKANDTKFTASKSSIQTTLSLLQPLIFTVLAFATTEHGSSKRFRFGLDVKLGPLMLARAHCILGREALLTGSSVS